MMSVLLKAIGSYYTRTHTFCLVTNILFGVSCMAALNYLEGTIPAELGYIYLTNLTSLDLGKFRIGCAIAILVAIG